MGYIREPDGIDFVICGKPLTEEEKKAISEFIQADKAKRKAQMARKVETGRREKVLQY